MRYRGIICSLQLKVLFLSNKLLESLLYLMMNSSQCRFFSLLYLQDKASHNLLHLLVLQTFCSRCLFLFLRNVFFFFCHIQYFSDAILCFGLDWACMSLLLFWSYSCLRSHLWKMNWKFVIILFLLFSVDSVTPA